MILWKNGILHTLEHADQTYQQMVTDQGVIVAFDAETHDLPIDKVIDLKGGHLYPGFVDSHLHLLGYGRQLTRPNMKNINDKQAMLACIIKHHDHVIFEGYRGEGLTFADLNQFDRPIVLRHRDYHSATVNKHVLKTLGINSQDGLLKEDLGYLAMSHYGQTTDQQLENMFEQAIQQLYAYGVTGGHSDDLSYFSNGFHGTLSVMNHVLQNMPFRAQLLVHHDVLDDYLDQQLPFLDVHPFLQLGPIKIFYDGTFSSKTALVSQPYVDDTFGLRIFEKNILEQLILKVRKHDLPLAIHVIGDQALDEVFDLLKKYPVKQGLHDRIIHASLWQEKSYEKARELPLIFDIQPQFLTSDIPDILSVFKKEPQTLYPFKTLMKQGIVLCGGSDAPVETPNPLFGMYDAIYRETTHHQIYHKEEQLTRFEALKLYTTNSQIPTYHTNRGYLKKGYVADFTVLQHDILTIPKAQFKSNPVTMTIIDEHIVYQDNVYVLNP